MFPGLSYMLALWRMGSASDSRSEGWVFEALQGQLTFIFLTCNTLPERGGKKKDPISSTSLVANAFKHMFIFDVISGNALNFR